MMVMDSGGGGCANQKVEFTFWTKKYPPPLVSATPMSQINTSLRLL